MKICVIGHTGFVGQTIHKDLSKKYKTVGVNSKTQTLPKNKFDIVVNCAGSTKKYIAQTQPYNDLSLNIDPFISILQLEFHHLIHISSIDALYCPSNNYSISKSITEQCVKLYFPNSSILRLGGIIGNGLKKNVVYDIAHNKDLFVTADSVFNYISTKEVSKIVMKIIELNMWKKTINIAACSPISVQKIIDEGLKYSIKFSKKMGVEKVNYNNININILKTFFDPKESEYYINEYFKSLTDIFPLSATSTS